MFGQHVIFQGSSTEKASVSQLSSQCQLVSSSVSQLGHQLVSQSVSQLDSWSVSQPVSQLISQSVR